MRTNASVVPELTGQKTTPNSPKAGQTRAALLAPRAPFLHATLSTSSSLSSSVFPHVELNNPNLPVQQNQHERKQKNTEESKNLPDVSCILSLKNKFVFLVKPSLTFKLIVEIHHNHQTLWDCSPINENVVSNLYDFLSFFRGTQKKTF